MISIFLLVIGNYMIKSYDKFLSKEVLPNANEIILEDTGLVGNAWGDGTHPSTNGLLNLILNTEFKPDETLLDWGTGSGVLSIFASKTKQIQSYGIELCIDSLNTAISNSKLLSPAACPIATQSVLPSTTSMFALPLDSTLKSILSESSLITTAVSVIVN